MRDQRTGTVPEQKPAFKGHDEPPSPILKRAGFHGSILDFNDHVERIAQAHQQTFGYNPPPGLTLDIARSPVGLNDYQKLFPAPNKRTLQAASTLGKFASRNADDLLHDRGDGVLTRSYPLAQQGTPSLQKKFPNVQMGMLPIASSTGLFQALQYLDRKGGLEAAITQSGLTADEFAREVKRGQAISPDMAGTADLTANLAQKRGAAGGPELHQAAVVGSATTIQQAQKELNKTMGTTLPVTGFFNETWVSALSNWMKSADYFHKVTAFQAKDAGFGSNVNAYLKAWKAKQYSVQHHGLTGHFLNAMPLQLFTGDLWALPKYLVGGGSDPVSVGLHALTRTAGLTLDTIGGTVSQAKADLAAGNQFAQSLSIKGKSFDEALQNASHTLKQNPTWLRIFYPDLPEHEKGVLKVVDELTNLTGDLILLGKPRFTGEIVKPGDLAAAKTSTYVNRSAHWAYDYLQRGNTGRAAEMLEGGQGANRLAAFAAPLIKAKQLTQEQFTEHLAELYSTGSTRIPLGRNASKDYHYNQFGELFPNHLLGESKTEARNLHDNAGNIIGSMVFDARPERDNIYVESIFIDPNHRSVNALRKLIAPLLKDGRPIRAVFQNERLQKLFERASSKGIVTGKALPDKTEATIKRGDNRGFVQPENAKATPLTMEITGSVLASLRTKYLATPGVPGQTWLASKKFTRDWLDAFDSSPHTIVGSKANALINTLRTSVEHVAPASMHYFDENLPGSIRHFIVDKNLGNRAQADKYASLATRYQATDNVVQLQNLQRKVEALYHAKYPLSKRGIPSEFEAVLETEAPSIFSFPAGGEQNIQGAFARIGQQTDRINTGLNQFAKYRTRLVLSTGLSLLYKHAVGDFVRFVYGGGITGNAKAASRIDALAKSDPQLERDLGRFLGRAELGETRYTLGRGGAYSVPAFRTGEAFNRTDHMVAAGGHLRRLLVTDALSAYKLSSGQSLDPLVQLILHNRTYRGMWHSAQKAEPELSAEDYASKIFERFAAVDEAASAAGVEDVWGKGLAVVRENRGAKVDEALGGFVKDNQLDFPVASGKIEAGGFDEVTGRIIGFLMKPNKYYRRRFAENVLHNTFDELTQAGFGEREAFDVGTNLASRLVKYHMLDFSNRLQVEQDLRWLSWFATKHRLYWKWVTAALVRSPGAAAVINDVQQALDDKGNLNFDVFGHKLSLPAARLVWVPGREYSEVSPDAQFVWYLVKNEGDLSGALKDAYMNVNGTGNIVTRVDTGLRMAARTARIMSGNTPSTYTAALAGLPELDKQRLQRDFNEYTLSYFHDHHHYPTERDVVRHVMWRATAENLWRSTLPLPVVPAQGDQSEQQQLVHQFMFLVDPAKRRDFLENHPGFSDHFGVWDDPKSFLHNHQMFGRYHDTLNAYRSARTDLYSRAKQGGMTPELVLLKRKLDKAFQKTFDMLLTEDARYAGIDVQPGETPGVGKVPLGPWGKLASADPQINPRHILNALFPKLQSSENEKVYGRLQKELQAELSLLSNPQYAATYPDPEELKTRKRNILQQLEVFRRYPSDALGQIQARYQTKYVNPYWKTLDGKLAQIQNMPADERDLAYAELRTWRDQQDHEVTVGGVRFPSPIRMAWATLDPNTRDQRLRYFAAKTWADLTGYEKELLGVKRGQAVAKGWQTFFEAYASVSQQTHLQGGTVPSGYKDVLAKDIARRVLGKDGTEFLHDYNMSKKPLYERLPLLSVVQDSKFKQPWHDLLDLAKVYGRYLKSGEYSSTSVKARWRQFLKSPGFLTEFDSTPKGFRDEIKDFGPNFLNLLIG